MLTPNPLVAWFAYGGLVALLLALVLLIAALWRWGIGRPQRVLGAGSLVAFGLGVGLWWLMMHTF